MKKKKRLGWLWGILITIGVVIVLPIATVYIIFYTNQTKQVTAQKEEVADFSSRLLVEGFEDAKTEHAIAPTITEQDFDNILSGLVDPTTGLVKDLPDTVKTFFKQSYIEITEVEGETFYTFYLDVDTFGIFKTRVGIQTKLSSETGEDGKTLKFQIVDIFIGRLHNLTWAFDQLYDPVLSQFLSDEQIQSALSNFPLSISVNLKEKMISYKLADLMDDISALMGSSSALTPYLEELYNYNLFDIGFSEEGIKAVINLESLMTNADYQTNDKNFSTFTIEDIATKTRTLYTTNIVDKDHLDTTFKYLIYGYDALTTEQQSYISPLDLSAIEIADATTYQGYAEAKNSGDFIGNIQSQVSMENLLLGKLCNISENDITSFLKGSGLVGNGFFLTHEKGDTKKMAYITFDNMYANVVNGKVTITIGMSFNGCETIITLTTAVKEFTDYKLKLHIDGLFFGSNQGSENFMNQILNMMGSAFSSGGLMSLDQTNKDLIFDLGSAIDTTIKSYITMMNKNIEVAADNAAINEEGFLRFTVVDNA